MKSLREKIEIEQYKLDGGEIEHQVLCICQDGLPWNEYLGDLFDWTRYDFRKKPKPMEIWVNVYDIDGSRFELDSYVHKTEEKAEKQLSSTGRTIKFIQAIE